MEGICQLSNAELATFVAPYRISGCVSFALQRKAFGGKDIPDDSGEKDTLVMLEQLWKDDILLEVSPMVLNPGPKVMDVILLE